MQTEQSFANGGRRRYLAPAWLAFALAAASIGASWCSRTALAGTWQALALTAFVAGLRWYELFRFAPVHRSGLLLILGAAAASIAGGVALDAANAWLGAAAACVGVLLLSLFAAQRRLAGRPTHDGPDWWGGGLLALIAWSLLATTAATAAWLIGYPPAATPPARWPFAAAIAAAGTFGVDVWLIWLLLRQHPLFPRALLLVTWIVPVMVLIATGDAGATAASAVLAILTQLYLRLSGRVHRTFGSSRRTLPLPTA